MFSGMGSGPWHSLHKYDKTDIPPSVNGCSKMAYCIIVVPDGRVLRKRIVDTSGSQYARRDYPWSVTISENIGYTGLPESQLMSSLDKHMGIKVIDLRTLAKGDLTTLTCGEICSSLLTYVYLLKLKGPARFRINQGSEVSAISVKELLDDMKNGGKYSYNTESVIAAVKDKLLEAI